jgi:Heavy-metal resistance
MTEGDRPATTPLSPYRRWLLPLLVPSLALNLLVGGAIAVRFLAPDRIERITGTRFSPLIPRSFIADLPAGRRKEFTEILGRNRGDFRAAFGAMRESALNFAAALEKQPYDEAQVLAAISDYGGKGAGLIQRGNEVTAELVRKLTPEERVLLAAKVRERATSPRSRRSKDSGPD